MYLSRVQLLFKNLRPEMLKNGNQPGLMLVISGFGSFFHNKRHVSSCFVRKRKAAFLFSRQRRHCPSILCL